MPVIITMVSVLVAIVMTWIAWRVTREERSRSAVRVALLAHDIREGTRASAGAPELYGGGPAPVPASRYTLPLAIGAFAVASAMAALILFGGGSPRAESAPHAGTARTTTTRATTSERPVELLALTHERDGDRLTIHGVVRNPDAGSEIDRLSAVVVVLGRDGAVLSTGRAAVESTTLAPGAEAPFAVTLPAGEDVGRYRVSFSVGDRAVPHVDRRSRS